MSKYYVSLYQLYPIYEPAEGGYYYSGVALDESFECQSWKKAKRKLRKIFKSCIQDKDTDEHGWYTNAAHTFFGVDGKYIGEGWFVTLERTKGNSESGWHPYE